MSTNDQKSQETPEAGHTLAKTMQALKSVDEKTPDAKRNATSIKDFQGRRIELGEGKPHPDTIYGEES